MRKTLRGGLILGLSAAAIHLAFPTRPCRRVPPQERIAPPQVDRKMILPFPKRTGDAAMEIKPLPHCPNR